VQNNTGKLKINQLSLTFNNFGCFEVGTYFNYKISSGIYKMFYLTIFYFIFVMIDIN
jgi:hypothetical protein